MTAFFINGLFVMACDTSFTDEQLEALTTVLASVADSRVESSDDINLEMLSIAGERFTYNPEHGGWEAPIPASA